MTTEHPLLLLDTNIWIDNYLENRKGCAVTRELIAYASKEHFTLAYAASSSKDVFYLIKSELKREVRESTGTLSETQALACSSLAWACLINMSEIAVSAPVGEAQIWLAQHYRDLHEDYEDDLVLAAAETSKADYFVTNDKNLMGKSATPTFTCSDMLAYFKMQSQDFTRKSSGSEATVLPLPDSYDDLDTKDFKKKRLLEKHKGK